MGLSGFKKYTHPVRSTRRAAVRRVTPKPVRKTRRASIRVLHPLSSAEGAGKASISRRIARFLRRR